jgi:hypothetical protein
MTMICEGRAGQLLGSTTMGYYDLKAYEDEWRTLVPLYITMFACRVFERAAGAPAPETV